VESNGFGTSISICPASEEPIPATHEPTNRMTPGHPTKASKELQAVLTVHLGELVAMWERRN
jgi:hypothetical protein